MLSTLLQSGVLGALLTLSPRPLYLTYSAPSGAAQALAEQLLAGLMMWVPMGTVYLLGAIGVAARFLRGEPSTPAPLASTGA